MFLPGGLTRMDQIVVPVEECFMMFVFMSLMATCIVQRVSKQMWCQGVQQRSYLMMSSKLISCPHYHQKSSYCQEE
jgi:uncharacterized membrane protein